ncbi:hypothetical protein ACFLS1_04665 [Verrucomicrobiota bacterium]
MSDLFEKIKRTEGWWVTVYRLSYGWAVGLVWIAFVRTDEAGKNAFVFDRPTTILLASALLVTLLTLGVHKKISLICMILLCALAVYGAVISIVNELSLTNTIFAWIAVAALFWGVVVVYRLKKLINEMRKMQAFGGDVLKDALEE